MPWRRRGTIRPGAAGPLALAENEQAIESGKHARGRSLAKPDALVEEPAIDAQLRDFPIDGLGARAETRRDSLPSLRVFSVPKEKDLADVLKREPDPLCSANELQTHECLTTVDPMTRSCSARCRKKSLAFVESYGIRRDAAASRQLSDFRSIFHSCLTVLR
jgi:hypothetical protein